MTRTRIVAAVAAVLGLVCAIALVLAVGSSTVGGYVSENGVAGSPHAALYRTGVLGIAIVAALLAIVLRKAQALAALPLAIAAPLITVSGAVSCTAGCPLPPYEPTTPADLVHAIASVLGVGCCALAMLALAWRGTGPSRLVSRFAVATGFPLLAATAVGIAAVGRGSLTGVMERLGLTVCALWLITIGALHAAAGRTR